MKRVVTFGEIMLRLAPSGYLRFLQQPSFEATFGGGEANVAVSLANFGMSADFVTKLPKNDIALAAVRELKGLGVGTSHIAYGGDRMGIYFVEKGASMRPSKVVYDRAHSSISEAGPGDFDWEMIFDGADWFHFTGITPALGENVAEIALEAAKAAKKLGVRVSLDLNYRKKLWDKPTANRVMTSIMPYVDVLIMNESDASDVFNISAPESDAENGKIDRNGYIFVANELKRRFENLGDVAITLRKSISANDNDWSGLLYSDGKAYFSKTYSIRIVDRVGGGDSFAAGLIYATLEEFDPQQRVEFAVAASALKHTVEGDYNRVSVDEVRALMAGNASGRVQR